MKIGMSLQELATQVQYVGENKRDFIVPASSLSFDISKDFSRYFDRDTAHQGNITDHAFKQISTDLGIPNTYRMRLIESGNHNLLQENMNTLVRQSGKNRMLRTVDGTMRGYMSDSFSVDYDNDVIFKAILPVLHDLGDDIEIKSCSLTDTKMYLKVTSKKLQADVKVGDPVLGGISIVNSEVGMSFYSENEFVERLVCLNGMTRPNNISSFRKMHRGSKKNIGSIRRDTMLATQNAIALQIRDSIVAALDPSRFMKTVEELQEASKREIRGNVPEAIKELGKAVGFTQSEGDDILKHLIQGHDLSQYGLLNAVTRYSQDSQVNYDRASELEMIGGKVLELSPRQWNQVSQAA